MNGLRGDLGIQEMGIKLSFKFVAAARGRWRMHTRCIVNIGVRGAGDTRGP